MRRLLLILLALVLLPAAAVADVVPNLPAGTWPLQPRPEVVRGFDPPSSLWGAGHRGVDLRGYPGQPVRAAATGTVTFASDLAGRGVVVVDHGSVRTTYEPVAAVLPVGTRVGRGQVIGHLQVGGSHCFPGACLHWGLRRGDAYLDPLLLVGLGPVRLLPLPPAARSRVALPPGALATGAWLGLLAASGQIAD